MPIFETFHQSSTTKTAKETCKNHLAKERNDSYDENNRFWR
jgi:hypothetical protein